VKKQALEMQAGRQQGQQAQRTEHAFLDSQEIPKASASKMRRMGSGVRSPLLAKVLSSPFPLLLSLSF